MNRTYELVSQCYNVSFVSEKVFNRIHSSLTAMSIDIEVDFTNGETDFEFNDGCRFTGLRIPPKVKLKRVGHGIPNPVIDYLSYEQAQSLMDELIALHSRIINLEEENETLKIQKSVPIDPNYL